MALYTREEVDAMLAQLADFKAALAANPEANPGWLEQLDGAEDAITALLGQEKPVYPAEELAARIATARQELIDAEASGDAPRHRDARIEMLELRLEREGVEA